MAVKRRPDDLIDQIIESLGKGDDDAAKILISVGSFITVSDISYRIATSEINVDTDIGFSSPLDIINKIRNNPQQALKENPFDFTSFFGVDIDLTVGEGLWDIKYTCLGAGAIASGVGLLFSNHPEWVSESIDAAQKIAEKSEALAMRIIDNLPDDVSLDMGDGGGSLLPALISLAGVGGATVAPGVPPAP